MLFQTALAVAAVAAHTPLASVSPQPTTLIGIEDKNMFLSQHNWAVNSTATPAEAVTANSGAYVKLDFSNSTTAALVLRPTKPTQSPSDPSTHYMNLVYTVDNEQLVEVPIYGNTSSIQLSTTLSPSRNHTVEIYVYNSLQSANRWHNIPHGGAALVVRGIELDHGAVSVLPMLRSKRMLLYGDSITEGVNAECSNPDPHCRGGDLCANAATKTWGTTVAAAFGAEYSQVGFGSLGWTVAGAGGVPPFYIPGNEAGSSWNKIYNEVNRTFENIDYIFVGHATNDGLRGATAKAVVASAQGWLTAVRQAAGPTTAIFLCVPFGGFGSANAPKDALKTAFDGYQTALGSKPDARTFFIDLGRDAAIGLECGAWERGCVGAYGSRAGASVQGCDGIHPRGGTHATARHGELGAMLAMKAAVILATTPAPAVALPPAEHV